MTAGRLQGRLSAPEIRVACLFALAIAVLRLFLARPLRFCGTPDACFYLGMGQTLAAGQGFHAHFLFDFQLAQLSLPNTGLEYWRPGISLLLQGLRPFGAVTLQRSILLTILVGIFYAAAAWHMAMRNYGDRRLALGAFALLLVAAPVWTGSLTPDSGLYYGAAVAWFLALFTVQRQGLPQDLLALGCVAAAYFIRNDAALLLVPLLAVLWGRRRTRPLPEAAGHGGSSGLYAAAMLCGFALALLPVHLLYRSVLGTAFPAGTGQALFLNDLSDFVRYNDPVSRHTLLAHGLKHLLIFRAVTLVTALYRIAALVIGYAGLIFLPGLLLRPRDGSTVSSQQRPLPELTGPITFLLTIFAVYILLLPAVGAFSILRSVLGVLPIGMLLIVLGIARSVLDPRLRTVLTVALVGTYFAAGVTGTRREVEAANLIGAADRAAAYNLAASGASPANAIVVTSDPVQFSVTTGYTTLALPINGLDAIAHAAQNFRATHVILNTDDLPASPGELISRLHPVRSETLSPQHLLILSLPVPAVLPKTGIGLDH